MAATEHVHIGAGRGQAHTRFLAADPQDRPAAVISGQELM